MKRIAGLLSAAVLFAAVSMAATWTGWISDEHCGAKGANAEHAACAKTCIKGGMKPVFVTDSGQVFKIKNPEIVAPHAGDRVVLTGSDNGGTIDVSKVQPVAKANSK
jgi:hypothetical protein